MPTHDAATPAFAAITPTWLAISGMSRSATYRALGRGELRAIKLGSRTLIDVEAGLAWLRSQPLARIAPDHKDAA